ncbi:MAG: hypothetical protein KC418_14795 [Anaerolineales bacterium]|nr:hypothetical protein [Anaerolineales bacterium]
MCRYYYPLWAVVQIKCQISGQRRNKTRKFLLDEPSWKLNFAPKPYAFYLGRRDPENPALRHEVPFTLHDNAGLLSAEVLDFSDWEMGQTPTPWMPTWTPPAVSAFSGAVTYNYPIAVPPGRRGLQPQVSLSYNSRNLDGAIHDPDFGLVATGWSLAQISILRTGVNMKVSDSNPDKWYVLRHPDEFRLLLNGTGHKLVPAGDTMGDSVRYYAEDAPQLRIYRYFDEAALNYDKLFWLVDTPDGTRYRLGYTTDSEEYQNAGAVWNLEISGHRGLDTGSDTEPSPRTSSGMAWHVDTVTDAFGNQMNDTYNTKEVEETYHYFNSESGDTIVTTVATAKKRLYAIEYNYPNVITSLPPGKHVNRLSSSPASRIEFRAANDGQAAHAIDPITSIYVFHADLDNPMAEPGGSAILDRLRVQFLSCSCHFGRNASHGGWSDGGGWVGARTAFLLRYPTRITPR